MKNNKSKKVLKAQYGYVVPTLTWSDIGDFLNKGAEVTLKTLEPIGRAISSVVANLPLGGASAVLPLQSSKNFLLAKQREKIFEEKVGPALSPSNHIIAWTQGSMNPKVGQRKIAEWEPTALLASFGVDMLGFKYGPKAIKRVSKVVDKTVKNIPYKEYKLARAINEAVSENPVITSPEIYNEGVIPEKRITYHTISLQEPSTSLKFFERKPAKISRAEKSGVPKLERNFTPKRHIAYYPGYQLKGLMKGSPLEKQLSKAGTINVKLLRTHFNKASQIEKDIVDQVLDSRIWGDNIDYNQFKKAVLNELVTYDRKPQTKYSDYGMSRIGYDGDIRVPNTFSGYMEVVLYKFPNRFLRKSSTEFIDTETGQSVTPFNYHDYDNSVIASLLKDRVTKNTFTFESPRLPLGNSKHYDASTLGHSRTYTTPEEPKVLHVMESQSDWGLTKLKNNSAPYTGTTEYLNDPVAYRKFIDGHKRLLTKMLENPSDYLAGAIEKQIANIKHHEAILKLMLEKGGLNPLAKYLHDNYLQRQLQENLKYASERGQTAMRYPTPETAAKIEGYTAKLQWYSPTGERLDMRNLEFDTEIGDFEYPKGSIMKNEYSPQHQTILKKYADFPKMFQKLFRGHPVEIVTDSKGNTWYLVDVPKGYLNKEWLYKKGGKTHKPSQRSANRPWGHRSVLDNGWQSTKQLKNTKNVYSKK